MPPQPQPQPPPPPCPSPPAPAVVWFSLSMTDDRQKWNPIGENIIFHIIWSDVWADVGTTGDGWGPLGTADQRRSGGSLK